MHLVVDANSMASNSTKDFLSTSSDNIAVLTYFAGMELLAPRNIERLSQSFEILCQFPAQVIILKSPREIIRENQNPKTPDPRGFIDKEQTAGIKDMCRALRAARGGNKAVIGQLRYRYRRSREEKRRLRSEAEKIAKGIEGISSSYSEKYARILRKKEPIPRDLALQIQQDILLLAAMTIDGHPDTTGMPKSSEVRNTYLFRFVLSCYALSLDWFVQGGLNNVRTDKLRNDVIDMAYVAHATFFDGLISDDAKMKRIYSGVLVLLDRLFSQA